MGLATYLLIPQLGTIHPLIVVSTILGIVSTKRIIFIFIFNIVTTLPPALDQGKHIYSKILSRLQ
jgi:hypothetical protein